jgi:hypothetical protein
MLLGFFPPAMLERIERVFDSRRPVFCGSLSAMSENTPDSAPAAETTAPQEVTRELGESIRGSGYFEKSAEIIGLAPSEKYEPPSAPAAFYKPEPTAEPQAAQAAPPADQA